MPRSSRGTTTGDDVGRYREDGATLMQLLRELRGEALTMVRQEVDLAKIELAEKQESSARKMKAITTGAVLVLAGVIVALQGVSVLIVDGLEKAGLSSEAALWLGPVLLGSFVVISGWGLKAAGKHALRKELRFPLRTMKSLKELTAWVKEKAKP